MVSYKKEFAEVFLSHKWGDSTNSGVNYKRKTKKTKEKTKHK